MRVDLRYQISLFGDFMHLELSSDITNELSNELSSFNLIPGVFVETKLSASGVQNSSRLCMRSADLSFSIEFKLDRIDFYLLNTDINVFDMKSIDSFAKQVKGIYTRIDRVIQSKIRRVGFVRYLLFIDDIDHSKVYKRLNTNIKFYENLSMKDWSNYLPASITLPSGIPANAVTTIKHFTNELKISSTIKQCDGVMVITDVNTLAENIELKYDIYQSMEIIDELQKVEYKLCSQITNFINGANEK